MPFVPKLHVYPINILVWIFIVWEMPLHRIKQGPAGVVPQLQVTAHTDKTIILRHVLLVGTICKRFSFFGCFTKNFRGKWIYSKDRTKPSMHGCLKMLSGAISYPRGDCIHAESPKLKHISPFNSQNNLSGQKWKLMRFSHSVRPKYKRYENNFLKFSVYHVLYCIKI